MSSKFIRIDYTNYAGERTARIVEPIRIYFGSTDHHPEQQWLMEAFDVRKKAIRHFAIQDVHQWTPHVD